jgi:hypothetical protein
MLSLFALFLGLIGMFGFWGLAWRLLKQPVSAAAIEPSPRPSVWRNEPTPGLGLPPAPSNPGFEDSADASIPSPRTHDSSNSNTQFFSRSDLHRRENIGEGTAILHDGLPSADRTAFLVSPFPGDSQDPPPPSHSSTVPPARLVPPPPPSPSSNTPPTARSRKTWLLGRSGPPDGR